MEKQKLIYVESKALFSPSEVSDKAIVFIKDTKEIWTHGVYFSCSGTWATPITLSLTGDTTGSVSIDGSGNASIATTTKYLSGMVSSADDCNGTVTTLPGNVTYYPCVLNGAANGFPTVNNANGILALNVHDYSYTHLLGFSSNGNIYHRRRSAGTWETTWKTILNSSNYTNFLDSVYLKKSGGTLGSSTASYTDLFIKSSTAKLRLTSFTDSTNYIQSGNSDFSGNATLKITGYNNNTGTNLYFNFANIYCRAGDYTNIDSGNYSSYALPLSGGTMTGALNFANNTWNKVGDDAYMGDCNVGGMIGIKGSNATPGFAMYNNSGTLLGKLYASGTSLYWSNSKILTSTDSIGEAYLEWGGRNLANNPGPIDAALAPSLGANRLAFLNPDAIDIKYSLDGGTTWADYGVTDAQKVLLFDGNHLVDLYLGGDSTQDTSIDRTSWRLRITLSAIGYNLYGEFKKFMIRVTSHGNVLRCALQGRSYSNVQNNVDTWVTFLDTLLSGWPGWNTINHPTGIIIPNTNHYGQIRFDFYMTALGSFGVPSHIHKIMGFAPTCWTWPSIMAGYGSIYSFDWQLNVTFPARITATGFSGNLTGNADTASKWKDARTITLTGDVTGSVSLDGSSNVTLTTATSGTGTTSFLKCPDKRNSYPALIVTSGGNIGAAFISTSTLGLSEGYYCDTLILRGYATHTAGHENALFFNKQNSSVYHSQYAFGSTTTWGTMYKFLDSGNYSSYALPLSGGTLTGILKSTLTAGSLGTSPIVCTGNAASTAGINNTYSHLASNLATGGALLIFLGKASSLYNGGSIGYWHKGGDGSSGNALTFSLHSANNLMVILGNGNVGINNTSPSHKLDVGGDIYSSGYVRAKSGFIKTDSSDSYVLLGGGGHKLLSDLSATHTHPWSDITSVPGLLGSISTPIFFPYANNSKLGAYISTINNRFYSADLRYTVTTTNLSGSAHLLFDDNYDGRMQIDKGTTATITLEGYNFTYNSGYIILYFYLDSYYPLLLPRSVTIVATDKNGTTYTLNRATSIETPSTMAFSIVLNFLTKLEITIVSLDNAYCGITNIDYFSRRTENTIRDCAVVTKYNANTLYHNLTAPKYIVTNGTSSQFLKADGSLDSTSYLPTAGGTLGGTSATETLLRLKSSTTTLRLVAHSGTTFNYIQSGNADFNDSTPLQITGYNGTVGSDLYLKFTNIYCRSGNYANIDSGNYSNYALKVDGTNGTSDGVSTLLNKLTTGTATPVDADYYICQYAGGGTTTTSYHRRPMSALYTYIKSKLSLNPDERFIYATSATSNQYGTTEATGSSSTLTRTLFWRDNDRNRIGIYVQHSDNLNYGFELASSYGEDSLIYRRKFNGTWETLQTVLTSSNYNNYSPTLTGTGASGTWAINISGVAASASKVANALTIQLNGGTTAGTNKFVYDGSSAYTINITPEAIGASATSHTHSYLPLSGGTLGSSTVNGAELNVLSSTARLQLIAYSDATNYIESGNSAFNGNATLKITGYSATTGSNLYFNFANIYCRAGNYTNIDSGNYSSYALPLSGGTLTDTLISRDIRPSANLSYSLGTSSYYYNYVYANYFKKNGSSDSYVLLGGGGHKAVSDFAPNNVANLSSSGMGNSDLWTLVFEKSYPANYWYNPTTMFYIRSGTIGCGILCFYNYWASGTQLNDYEKEAWFFGAGKSETGTAFGGANRDINDFFRIYIDKANFKYCMYYNRYNNLSLQILELLFFTVPEPGEYISTGSLRTSFFTNSTTVVDLPTESSTLVRVPIKTTYNHDRTIKTTKSIYASSFYENSDIRLKENVRGIDLSDLTKLVDLVQFNFKDSGTKKYGVIAQLLELVGLQNLVYENNGNKAVDYISLLVLEIQRLRNEIGELKLEINKKS